MTTKLLLQSQHILMMQNDISESDVRAGKGFVDKTDIEAIYRKIGYKCKAMTEYGTFPN
jgi:hypothetical protein